MAKVARKGARDGSLFDPPSMGVEGFPSNRGGRLPRSRLYDNMSIVV